MTQPKPNTMDDWIESLEKMFPVNTGDKQLDFANANKILGIREIADQLTAKMQEVDRAARTSERDRIFAAMRHVQWLGKDVNSKEIMKVRKEWDKTAANRLASLKGGDV